MSSNGDWRVVVDSAAEKALDRMPTKDAERILDVIGALPNDPRAGDTQKLKGEENTWRRRIGSYRIFFELYPVQRVIHIQNIRRRTSNTY